MHLYLSGFLFKIAVEVQVLIIFIAFDIEITIP